MGNKPRIVFVAGGNRGIGLEFIRQLHPRGDTVIGGYRAKERSKQLLKMAVDIESVHAFKVDVTVENDLQKLKEYISETFGRLDLLVCNAGIYVKKSSSLDELEGDDMLENFRVNVVGPFLTAKYLRPLLAKSKSPRIVNITSQMGSISHSSGGSSAYRISKAALNMLTNNQAMAYLNDKIITLALHPGWVRTDMGGPNASLKPEESVSGMLKVIDGMTKDHNGAYMAYDGRMLDY